MKQEKILDYSFGGYGEGIHYNLPDEAYHRIGAVSSHMVISGLKSLRKAHAYYHKTFKPTPAFELGRLTHLAILEPDRYNQIVIETDLPDRRVKAYKDAVAANPGKTILVKKDAQMIRDMKKAVYANALAPKTLVGGRTEVTVFVIDPITKLPLKGRIDYVSKKEDYLLDYKTAAQIQSPFFENDSCRYGYHLQAAFYLMLMNLVGKKIEHYFLLAQEKSDDVDYDCILYKIGFETLEKGESLVNALLPKIEESFRTNFWPGYSSDYEILSLPEWGFAQEVK